MKPRLIAPICGLYAGFAFVTFLALGPGPSIWKLITIINDSAHPASLTMWIQLSLFLGVISVPFFLALVVFEASKKVLVERFIQSWYAAPTKDLDDDNKQPLNTGKNSIAASPTSDVVAEDKIPETASAN